MKAYNTNNNEAMDFAYAMGLKRDHKEEETNDALSFAYSMGLRRYNEGLGHIERKNHTKRQVAEPRFA